MRYYSMALRAVSGDEAARQWLAEHAFHPEQDMRRTIIACDFDGTLCESDYPAIIRPNEKLIAALRMMKEMGYELILWTCRGCDDLDEAVVWLREQGEKTGIGKDGRIIIDEAYLRDGQSGMMTQQ